MTPSDYPNQFNLGRKVAGSFRYRVEAGQATTPSYQVEAVTRVELASQSPVTTVTPPKYAQATWDKQVVEGLSDLIALQHSNVQIDLRFNRAAVAANLEWKVKQVKQAAAGTEQETVVVLHPLELTPERLAPPHPARGSHRQLSAHPGRRARYPHRNRTARTITVKKDMPPQFARTPSKTAVETVLPTDKLPVELGVDDDVAVARADVEYRVNNGQTA